jgi:cob(I)alamin adenosyltransferase
MKRGLVQIYTGDGKGKTTAAAGLALRARGHGLRVCYFYFHKDVKRWDYGEIKMLKKAGVEVRGFACKHPHFYKKTTAADMSAGCARALTFIQCAMSSGKYDLMILDEILVSVRDGFITEGQTASLIRSKPDRLELVLTGRGATKRILQLADYVSEIKCVKHPYDSGLPARKGIEF